MSNKKTNSTLVIVLLVLLAAVVINQLVKSRKGERTFKSELVSFSADEVQSISIFTKENNFDEMKLNRNGDEWRVSFQGVDYSADADMIANMANDLGSLKADRLVANHKDKWADFNVTDTSGVRVVAHGDKGELCDIFIGRFSYDQATRKASTYVRLNDDKEVYSVEGYLSMLFNRDVNGFRNKSLYRGNQNDITKITFRYPADSSFVLNKIENKWMLGEEPADSVATAQYLGGVSYLVGSEFNDDFDPTDNSYQSFTATIEGSNMTPVVLNAYRNEEGETVIVSSLNPASYLDAGAGNLFDKVFKGPGYFSIKGD